MRLKELKFLGMAMLASQLVACASSRNVDFSVIHQASQCGYAEAGISHLKSTEQQTLVINKLTPFSDESDRQALRSLFAEHALKENLFLIAQGTKPTPGYGFEVTAHVAPLEKNTLRLPIRFSQPDKDRMLAQMLTSPCMVLGIDSNAQYQGIEADTLSLEINEKL
jgi:hypothetical protein